MESFSIKVAASKPTAQRAHIGVVGSGDLEVLIEPATNMQTEFIVRTSANGFKDTWEAVLQRFAQTYNIDARITINDFGATPGVVSLRLAQAAEIANKKNTSL